LARIVRLDFADFFNFSSEHHDPISLRMSPLAEARMQLGEIELQRVAKRSLPIA
jgi:hypothetical protein